MRTASAHVLRFAEPLRPVQLVRSRKPAGAAVWLAGPEVTFHLDGAFTGDDHTLRIVGVWDSVSARDELFEDLDSGPWPAGSTGWHAALTPYKHHGTVNWTDDTLFPAVVEAPGHGPVVAITTTAFWPEPERVAALVEAVAVVQSSLDSAVGLRHSTLSIGRRNIDGRTITVWDDDAAATTWAYRGEPHRTALARQRAEELMPRSSFTRFRIDHEVGAWPEVGE